jgi:hypothetical protein
MRQESKGVTAMMTARTICEQLTRQGFGITIIYHVDDRITVRTIDAEARVTRAAATTELQAAVSAWNRLGCRPRLRVRPGNHAADAIPDTAPSWPRRLLLAGMRLVRGPVATSTWGVETRAS